MGYAWAPQIMGLTRNEPKLTSRGTAPKHRAQGIAFLMEAMEERASDSPTLDRSRSNQNAYWHKWQGDVSGTAAWDGMCADADDYRVKVKLKNGKTAERKLPADAVVGWAMIIKPPPLMIAELQMTPDDIERFCEDAFEVMGSIKTKNGHNFFNFDNLECDALHFDEGSPHYHKFGKPLCDGRYCGNEIDADYCNRINQEFPRLMRGLGWPIDDLDVTDWERAKTDDAYREERNQKRRGQGKSVRQYHQGQVDTANETGAKIIAQAYQDAKATRDQADKDAAAKIAAAELEAAQIRAKAQADAETIQAKLRAKMQTELDEKRKEYRQLEQARNATRAALHGDLETWADLTPKPDASKLLGVLGAAVRASRQQQPTKSGVGDAWARMMQMVRAADSRANPGPTAVDGPTR